VPKRARLDAELVRRRLARSREHASALITEGKVTVRGMVATKSATGVESDAAIVVRSDDDPGWASRGAYKLLGALEAFEPQGLAVTGKRCLDAGASTGGFTDVLLRNGADTVVAADVGRGLLDWRLRTDDRVVVLDKTNVRNLTPDDIGGEVDLIVGDLSFISLKLVLPALVACMRPGADPSSRWVRKGWAAVASSAIPSYALKPSSACSAKPSTSVCGWRESSPARCPGRRVMSSTSSGCGETIPSPPWKARWPSNSSSALRS
jgi:TlyA family rRNA methyltransferase/putative hemolysin